MLNFQLDTIVKYWNNKDYRKKWYYISYSPWSVILFLDKNYQNKIYHIAVNNASMIGSFVDDVGVFRLFLSTGVYDFILQNNNVSNVLANIFFTMKKV